MKLADVLHFHWVHREHWLFTELLVRTRGVARA
jgi:hypothetical protein